MEEENSTIYKLEDHISFYSNKHYDPKTNAQHFFSINSEAEIQKNLNSIGQIQTSVEYFLSEKVRQHYTSFLKANDKIRTIGTDINDLSVFVKNTQQLLEVMIVIPHFRIKPVQ